MIWDQLSSLRLRNAPRSFKAFAIGYLGALSLAYVYALGNIALVVGLTPKDIAIHYYGASVKVVEAGAGAVTGEQALNLDDLGKDEEKSLGPRPSFKTLVGEGHFHLFGMSSFFFGLCILALFTGLRESWKTVLVGGTFVFIILDNVSFMATRFLGPPLALMTAFSGGLMGLCFMALWGAIVTELLQKRER